MGVAGFESEIRLQGGSQVRVQRHIGGVHCFRCSFSTQHLPARCSGSLRPGRVTCMRLRYCSEMPALAGSQRLVLGNFPLSVLLSFAFIARCDINAPHAGGQCKRVNIGIALVTKPRVLFLDEPTSGLDSYTSNEVCTCYRPGSHKRSL